VPYRVHTVLTDNGLHFTTPGNSVSAAPLIREAIDRGEIFRAHSCERACAQSHIEHRPTKWKGPPQTGHMAWWTDCCWMNSRGERKCNPLWGWMVL